MTKETDQVRMVGILPAQGADPIPVGKIPDGATQVSKSGQASNESTLIHTVTAGKTLYLVHANVIFSNDSGSNGSAYLHVTNASDVRQYAIVNDYVINGQMLAVPCNFPTPLEIPPGYKLAVWSAEVALYVYVYIYGYEK